MKSQWPYIGLIGVMVLSVGAIVYAAMDHRFDPKPAAVASYAIHAGSPACYARLMKATHGAYYGSTDIGQWLRLKQIAESCGGRVDLEN